MFHFGTPEDNARMYLDAAGVGDGSGYEDFTVYEWKEALVRTRIAYRAGILAEADEETLVILKGWYDSAFYGLTVVDDSLIDAIKKGVHRYIRTGAEERLYYDGLITVALGRRKMLEEQSGEA